MTQMRMLLRLVAVACLGGYVIVHAFFTAQPAPSATPPEQFPIRFQFELPRDYGYFIGDLIPLTLVIETTADVVLDMVNLPQKGDTHGLFDIRDLQITASAGEGATKIYHAAYTLQYFGPTPFTATFGPLEIFYALPPDTGAPNDTYTYKRLLSQTTAIHIARLGPLRTTQAIKIKGPLNDQRAGRIWLFFTGGTLLMCAAIGGWGREGYTAWQRYRTLASRPPTAAEQALKMLQDEGTVLFHSPAEPVLPARVKLDRIIRSYLSKAHQVPALTLTVAELVPYLDGVPYGQDILSLIERCATLKYQPPAALPSAEEALWWDTMALFQQLQKEGMS